MIQTAQYYGMKGVRMKVITNALCLALFLMLVVTSVAQACHAEFWGEADCYGNWTIKYREVGGDVSGIEADPGMSGKGLPVTVYISYTITNGEGTVYTKADKVVIPEQPACPTEPPPPTETATPQPTITKTEVPTETATPQPTITKTEVPTETATATPGITTTHSPTPTEPRRRPTRTPVPQFYPSPTATLPAIGGGDVCPPQLDKIVTLNMDFSGTVLWMEDLVAVDTTFIQIDMPEGSTLVPSMAQPTVVIFDGKDCKLIFPAILAGNKVSDLFEVSVYGGVPTQLTDNASLSEPQYLKHEEGIVSTHKSGGTSVVMLLHADGEEWMVFGQGQTPGVSYDDTIAHLQPNGEVVVNGAVTTDLTADRIIWDPTYQRWLVWENGYAFLQDYADLDAVETIPQGISAAFQPSGEGYVTLNKNNTVTIYTLTRSGAALKYESYPVKEGAKGVIWIRGNNELKTGNISLNKRDADPEPRAQEEIPSQVPPAEYAVRTPVPPQNDVTLGSMLPLVVLLLAVALVVGLIYFLRRKPKTS